MTKALLTKQEKKEEKISIVELLLKENADVNDQDKEGWTALMIASRKWCVTRGEVDGLKTMASTDQDYHFALEEGFYNGGYSKWYCPWWEELISAVEKGSTALILASKGGHEQVVQTLVSAGANPNIQDKTERDEWTALMLASQNGHTQVVETTTQENADVNAQNEEGETALMIASNDGYTEVVKLLLKDNADVNTPE
ncbi:kinase D-interacting substrate of 220 kDa-like [Gigantopelta aegis]|uniref:kinase D-interacting substrate of 220 kDa-like n=1 Tax=Gigantopelta aegis TaxID=1735272 RepID=UPI001B88E5B7|nr:kinase D-interacting substrate of 220 kDa-like [Gigantopelta aegis]